MRGSAIIRDSAEKDPKYAPYCLGCSTMERMQEVERFYWRCRHCGGEQDSRDEGGGRFRTPYSDHGAQKGVTKTEE